MAIYKKLAKIQAEVRGLTKNKGAYNYDYLTGDKLLSEIRPRMVELGLLLLPEVIDIKTDPITYDSWNKQGKFVEKKTEVLATVKMRMTWVDSEDNETLSQEWGATGMNAFDKGFGSSLTYGERYYLLKLFHIPTDRDDVDAIATVRDANIDETSKQKGKRGSNKGANNADGTNPLQSVLDAINTAKNRSELDNIYEQWGNSFTGADAAKFYDALNIKSANL